MSLLLLTEFINLYAARDDKDIVRCGEKKEAIVVTGEDEEVGGKWAERTGSEGGI